MTMLPSSTYTRACALWRWTGSEVPGEYSTVIIRSSLPGISDNGFDISEVTFASCAISGLHTRERLHTRNNMSRIFFIAGLLLFLMSYGLILCRAAHTEHGQLTADERDRLVERGAARTDVTHRGVL